MALRRLSIVFLMSAVAGVAADAPNLPAPASRKIDPKEIQTLFSTRCYGCHGAQQQMSGLRLDQGEAALRGGYSGPVIKPGASADSALVHRIAGVKGIPAMPPAGPRLTAEQVGIVRAWIDQGASWGDVSNAAPVITSGSRKSSHWAFQPVRRPAVPAVALAERVRNPIDAFVLARLEREKIAPSPEASKITLLRRVSLDLTGIPPSPEEIDEFLADKRPDAYDRVVDRLLASPHYGEKWARHWLDLARYADSDGYEKDWFRPWAWRYREWVINAINRDMPFDQFTIDQLAGDLLPHASVEQHVATGFQRNTLTNREGGVSNAQFRFEDTIDRAATVGSVWLGLTVGCAQCHDHKFDPISQKDFYQLFAFFDNVEEADVDAPMPGELGPYLSKHGEYERKRQELLTEYHVAELQADWEARMRGAAATPGKWLDWDLAWDCVQKLTEGGDGAKILNKPSAERSKREQDVLTDHFIRNYHFAVGPKKYAEVKFKELDEKLRGLKSSYPQLSQAMTLAELRQPHPSFLRVRGDYKNPGVEVKPTGLSVLPPLVSNARPTRLDLAHWLVSPANPLTSRVAVNRIWQELFGQGIVKSSDDFGTRGDLPSHPELLDWLATQFVDSGWSRKQVIRTIVTSATYRQSSKARPELDATDPSNALLARQARLRLSAELIRDSALSASGLLSLEVGGKSVRPPQPAGVMEIGYGKRFGNASWDESKGADRYRRGIYIQFQRSTPYPQLVTFDAPMSKVPVCRRDRSNTSLQALNLLNDPVFTEAAQALAYRVISSAPDNFAARLSYAFKLSVGREPTEPEVKSLEKYLERQRTIFAREPGAAAKVVAAQATEPETLDLACWTGLSSVLLNLDEFITRE
ncbi:MAG: PSD1 and planctomycete cytochrome C domain-containing protein [Bryobacteraceae bacterium]